MAKGINKAIIVGNMGQDPDIRHTDKGICVATISVATSQQWKDKDDKKQEQTEWHRIVFFNKLAEITEKYLKKGSKVYIEGSLRTRKWQDKDGIDRYITEIIGREMQMLDSKQHSESSNSHDPDHVNYADLPNDAKATIPKELTDMMDIPF